MSVLKVVRTIHGDSLVPGVAFVLAKAELMRSLGGERKTKFGLKLSKIKYIAQGLERGFSG